MPFIYIVVTGAYSITEAALISMKDQLDLQRIVFPC